MKHRTAWRDFVVFFAPLAVLCGFAFFYHLGAAALFEPDEGRNADKARDILLLSDWITPYTNFVPALDKPIFYYWLVAIAYKIFGVSEFSARLPSALAGLACVVLVYYFAKRYLGPQTALWSSLVLVGSVEYLLLARIVIFDMPLALTMTLSLCAFYAAQRTGDAATRSISYALMYIGAAAGMLIKGPIGLILPGMIVIAYIVAAKKWSLLREMHLFAGTLLVLGVAAPWYIWCEIKNPGYLRYFLWEENFVRYFTPHFNRPGPWYYFVVVLLVGFLPWTLLLPFVFSRARKKLRDDAIVFLLLWAGLPFLFFSLSSSKLPHYILPVFPPLALLTGGTIAERLESASNRRVWPLSLPWLTLIFPLILLAAVLYWPGLAPPEKLRPLSAGFDMLPRALIVFTAAAAILVGWASVHHRWKDLAFPVSCAAMLLFVCLTVEATVAVSHFRSSKDLADRSASLIDPQDQLTFYDTYPSSLPFYLHVKQPILMVWSGTKASVMGSFYIAERNPKPAADYGAVLVTFDEFKRRWQTRGASLRVFLEKKDFAELADGSERSPKVLLDTGHYLLVSNQ